MVFLLLSVHARFSGGAEVVVDDRQHECEDDQEEAVEYGEGLTEVNFLHQRRVDGVDDNKAEVGQSVEDEHRDAEFGLVPGSVVLAEFYCWSVSHKL